MLRRSTGGIAILALAGLWGAWIMLANFTAGHDDQTRLIFWLQTLSGNWSPVPRPGWISNREYSGSALVAVVINYAPWVAIIGFLWKAILT